jgi:hypothetical protein
MEARAAKTTGSFSSASKAKAASQLATCNLQPATSRRTEAMRKKTKTSDQGKKHATRQNKHSDFAFAH